MGLKKCKTLVKKLNQAVGSSHRALCIFRPLLSRDALADSIINQITDVMLFALCSMRCPVEIPILPVL